MQTQEKPVDQKIDPKKKYQLSANPCDGRGAFWLYAPSEGDSTWVQFPFEANKQPTFLSMQQISQVAVGADEKIIWFLTDETGQGYRYVPPASTDAAGQGDPYTSPAAKAPAKQEEVKQESPKPESLTPGGKRSIGIAKGGWLGKVAIWTMAALLCLVLVAVAAINIHPFVQFLGMMAAQIGLTKDIEDIPVLKDVGAMFGVSALVLIAFCWWAVMQLMELSPQFVASNGEKILERAEVSSFKSRSFSTNDSNLQWLQKKEAKKHGDAVAYFRAARLVVYGIETFVVMTVTNPVKGDGGFGAFLLYLISFQWGKINWGVIALLLSVLFLVEIIFRTIRHLKTLGKTL